MKRILQKYEINILLSALFFVFSMLLYYKLYSYSPDYMIASYLASYSLFLLNIYFFSKYLVAFFSKKISINLFFVISSLLLLLVITLSANKTLWLDFFPDMAKHKFKIIIFMQILQFFISTCYFFGKKIIENKKQDIVFKIQTILGAVLYSSIIIFFLTPLRIYATDPDEVALKLSTFILFCFIIFIIVFLVLLFLSLLFRLMPASLKKIIITIFYFIAAIIFLYTFIITGNFGALDKFILTASNNLYNNFYRSLVEVFFFIIFFHFILFLVSGNKTKILSMIFLILIIPALLETVVAIIRSRAENSLLVENETAVNFLPKNNSQLMGFTKQGKNIMVFFLDAFSGGYMPRILEELPKIKDNYTGFTWYPNTLTIGYFTNNSVSTMYGGWKYSPVEINKQNTKIPLLEKIAESYAVLPTLLGEKGYVSSYTDIEYYKHSHAISSALIKRGVNIGFSKDYVTFWEQKNNINEQQSDLKTKDISVQLLTMVSIFKASPFFFKPIIYDNAEWHIIRKNDIKSKAYNYALNNWAFLDVLADISNTDEKNNTFKYFRTNITHPPYAISKDGVLLENEFPDPKAGNNLYGDNAYYSAKASIEAISRWIIWLKNEEIYDNTMIIIASDHGNNFVQNPMMSENFFVDGISGELFNRMQALLMVKLFDDNFLIKRDYRFMSNGDVPAIICGALGIDNKDIGEDPTVGKPLEGRVLDTIMSDDSRGWEALKARNRYVFDYHYKVKNNIFESSNWEKIE